MLKSHREKAALRQLKTEETELHLRLTQIRKAISVLDDSQSEPGPNRPQCRADLLRDYLLDHPSGVRLKDVPAVLKAMGHVSFAAHPTTNWVYQLKPEKAYFVINSGIITLHPEFNGTNPGASSIPLHGESSKDKAPLGDKQEPETGLTPPISPSQDLMTSQAASN